MKSKLRIILRKQPTNYSMKESITALWTPSMSETRPSMSPTLHQHDFASSSLFSRNFEFISESSTARDTSTRSYAGYRPLNSLLPTTMAHRHLTLDDITADFPISISTDADQVHFAIPTDDTPPSPTECHHGLLPHSNIRQPQFNLLLRFPRMATPPLYFHWENDHRSYLTPKGETGEQ